jgi:hypothetical protein
MTYAQGTSVSVEKSKMELDVLLKKHGAQRRVFGDDSENGKAFVIFEIKERQFRLDVPLPKLSEFSIGEYRGKPAHRNPEQKERAHEQACRERWRAILLLVKAKLETIALGLSTVDREFLADLMLPNGRTVHSMLSAQVEEMYKLGGMPKLLGGGS